jgi:hypothetical protein
MTSRPSLLTPVNHHRRLNSLLDFHENHYIRSFKPLSRNEDLPKIQRNEPYFTSRYK